ncbi:MAG: PAS domain-containing protein, partial [Solirubrobacterales bacterium]|nr:PAS domain-containing protein [Solirubrobacterales bacterium]
MAKLAETSLDTVLEFVNQARGFDFTGYKRSSIERRVAKRMTDVGVQGYEEYIDYLELHPEEFAALFNTILINVTSFFRDPPMWEYLAGEVVPAFKNRPGDGPIRAWCAGCASGEEPYTLAMVLARVLGDKEFQDRVKIYATDIDEEALDHARHGAYLPRQIEDVPRDALERFFERTDQRYVFRKDLRRSVIFGRNDLVQDAPISRIDLLICRNTLMYFTAETQSRILDRFHFALDDNGILMLGKSEMLIAHSDLFTPVDMKRRVFRRVLRQRSRGREHTTLFTQDRGGGTAQNIIQILRETAFDVGGAHVVVDAAGVVVMANEAARGMFSLGLNDLGRPIQELELSYRPLELHAHLEAVANDLSGIEISAVAWRSPQAKDRFLNVRLTPLLSDGELVGTSISYIDVTDTKRLQEQLISSRRELETAYEELQSTVEELETTNEELQSTNEELETTNEELQSTVEELETTNEELQSTNEELETMNEELQSTNEELHTMNDELRQRSEEVSALNNFLGSVLAGVKDALIVI